MSHLQTVDVNTIRVRNRVRKDLGDIDSLKESMRRSGLLNPVIITTDFCLVAGQRRLEAAKRLGWKRIQCYVIEAGDPEALLQVELDENAVRKDFTSDELADALVRLDALRNPPLIRRIIRWFRRLLSRIGSFFRRPFRRGGFTETEKG